MKYRKFTLGLIALLFVINSAWAQSDDPCGAPALTVNASCSFTTGSNAGFTATAGVPAPGCGNYVGGDAWFTTTVPVSGHLIFDTNTGVITDGGMAIYSGTCGSLTLEECDDDDSANGVMSMIDRIGLTPGATIWIRVWEYGNNNNGTFDICVVDGSPLSAAPANDDPCNAIALTVNSSCTFATYTNASATATAGVPAPGCGNYIGGDVWFTAVVPASGNLIFDTNTGVVTDGGMAIYTGACGALVLVECDDDDSVNGVMPMINSTGLTPGATIWIRVWEYGNDNNGTFDICVHDNTPVGPVNDEPCTATALAVGASCSFSTYTNAGANNSSLTVGVTLPTCSSYSGGDVWFTVTVPASGHLIFDSNTGVILDSGMEIYRGTCGALTGIDCDDDGSLNGAMSMVDQNALVPGETIWIRMWEYGADNNGTFDLCIYDGGGGGGGPCSGGAGGQDCAQQQPICTDNTYCYSAGIGAVASPGNDYGCLLTQPNPSWYFFEISAAGSLVFDLTATSDIDFAVWGPYADAAAASAACGALPAPADCSYSISPTEEVNVAGVSVGEIYILVVTNYAAVVQDITIGAAGGNTAATNCAIVNPTPCNADAGNW
jgi:hypothetical protein